MTGGRHNYFCSSLFKKGTFALSIKLTQGKEGEVAFVEFKEINYKQISTKNFLIS